MMDCSRAAAFIPLLLLMSAASAMKFDHNPIVTEWRTESSDNIVILEFETLSVEIEENTIGVVRFNYSTDHDVCLKAFSEKHMMADMAGEREMTLWRSRKPRVGHTIRIRNSWTGYARLTLTLSHGWCGGQVGDGGLYSGNGTGDSVDIDIMVMPYDGIAQNIFFFMIFVMVWLNSFIIGLENSPRTWRKDWKRFRSRMLPVILRYLLNPILAACLSLMFMMPEPYTLTMMLLSVLPGCGISRLMAYLFGGNKQLSYTQGIYSILLSLVAIPAVLYCTSVLLEVLPFEPYSHNDYPMHVLNLKIVCSYVGFVFPVLPGMLLRHVSLKKDWFPMFLGPQMGQFLKPVALSVALCVLAFGLYTHMFVFFRTEGYIFGCVIIYPILTISTAICFSVVTRQSVEDLLTTIPEWWIQNVGVGLGMTRVALPPLDAALALTVFIPYALWTLGLNILLYSVYVALRHSIKYQQKRRERQEAEEREFLSSSNRSGRRGGMPTGRLNRTLVSGGTFTTQQEMIVMPDLQLVHPNHSTHDDQDGDSGTDTGTDTRPFEKDCMKTRVSCLSFKLPDSEDAL